MNAINFQNYTPIGDGRLGDISHTGFVSRPCLENTHLDVTVNLTGASDGAGGFL